MPDAALPDVPDRPATDAQLEVNEAADGLVIYDTRTDRVHHLNPTASAVFVLCTGANTLVEIADELGAVFDLPAPPLVEVTQCVATFAREGLLR